MKRRTFETYEQLERALRDYLKGIVWYHSDKSVTRYVKFQRHGNDRISARIYTPDHCYCISASTSGYLGCTAGTRKARAGEDWNRGNDLPDGPFNKRTWERIKNAIIGYELNPLSTEILSRLERQGIDTGDKDAKDLAKLREEQEGEWATDKPTAEPELRQNPEPDATTPFFK